MEVDSRVVETRVDIARGRGPLNRRHTSFWEHEASNMGRLLLSIFLVCWPTIRVQCRANRPEIATVGKMRQRHAKGCADTLARAGTEGFLRPSLFVRA